MAAAPLRAKLVVILAALVLVALAITGVASVAVLRSLLVGQVDDQLTSTVHFLVRSGGTEQSPTPSVPTSFVGLATLQDGTSLPYGRPSEESGTPNFPKLTQAQAKARGPAPYTVTSANGTHWRMKVVPVFGNGGTTPGSLAVAIPLDGVDRPVHRLALIETLVGIAVLASIVGLGFVVVRRSLRPLREVETVAGAIAAGDLTRRVPEQPVTTEVGRLSRSLNGMLAQIEHAFDLRAASEARMRQFVADASHELRTPLAAVRGYAELYRQGAVSDPDDVASAMRRIEDEAARMGLLVEDLLLLARLDEERPSRTELVDLTVLAADAVQDARAIAPDRTITLLGLTGAIAPTEIAGDERRLRQVITNLTANAVSHTAAGTPIEIAVGPTARGASLEVRDHGAGIEPDQVGRVFERFFRADPSRTRGRGGGTGLGLAIVAAIVGAHDGRVGVTQTPGGGATFVVELPSRAIGPAAAMPADAGRPADEPASAPVTEVLDSDAAPSLPANSQP